MANFWGGEMMDVVRQRLVTVDGVYSKTYPDRMLFGLIIDTPP